MAVEEKKLEKFNKIFLCHVKFQLSSQISLLLFVGCFPWVNCKVNGSLMCITKDTMVYVFCIHSILGHCSGTLRVILWVAPDLISCPPLPIWCAIAPSRLPLIEIKIPFGLCNYHSLRPVSLDQEPPPYVNHRLPDEDLGCDYRVEHIWAWGYVLPSAFIKMWLINTT